MRNASAFAVRVFPKRVLPEDRRPILSVNSTGHVLGSQTECKGRKRKSKDCQPPLLCIQIPSKFHPLESHHNGLYSFKLGDQISPSSHQLLFVRHLFIVVRKLMDRNNLLVKFT